MPHQYKRRTYDEGMQLAQSRFLVEVRQRLTDDEIEEMHKRGTISGGSIGEDWANVVGREPEKHLHYEYRLYLPSSECPYIEKYYARILVTRDRNSNDVWIKWKPAVPSYKGPWFS